MEICRVGRQPQLQQTLIKPVFCPPPSLMCSVVLKLPPLQDQLSADMYGFVAKEIDYASYFQTVSTACDQNAAAEGTQNVSDSLMSLCS